MACGGAEWMMREMVPGSLCLHSALLVPYIGPYLPCQGQEARQLTVTWTTYRFLGRDWLIWSDTGSVGVLLLVKFNRCQLGT